MLGKISKAPGRSGRFVSYSARPQIDFVMFVCFASMYSCYHYFSAVLCQHLWLLHRKTCQWTMTPPHTPTSFDMFGSFLICMGHFVFSTALHRHDQLAKYHPVLWLRWHNVSWHQVFRLPEGWGGRCPEIWSSDMFDMSSTSGYVGENFFRNLAPDFLTCPQLVGT